MAKINESFKAKEDALDQEDGQGHQKLQRLQQDIERTREQTSDLERQRERSSTENTALRVSIHTGWVIMICYLRHLLGDNGKDIEHA